MGNDQDEDNLYMYGGTRSRAPVLHSPLPQVKKRNASNLAQANYSSIGVKGNSDAKNSLSRKNTGSVTAETSFVIEESRARDPIRMEQQLEEFQRRLADVETFQQKITALENKITAGELRIEDLRAENDRQKGKIQELENRNVAPEPNNVANDNMIGNLINSLQRLNTQCRRPEFDGRDAQNPKEFIQKLERDFEISGTRENSKLVIAEDAMKGLARLWLDARGTRFGNYQEFKDAFLETYDSSTYRMKAKMQWSLRRYSQKYGGLQEFFLNQVKEAKYIFPDFSARAINIEIAQQFPENVRSSLATADFTNNETISNALAYLDTGSDHREKKKVGNDMGDNSYRTKEGVRNIDVARGDPYEKEYTRGNDHRWETKYQARENVAQNSHNNFRGQQGGNFAGNRNNRGNAAFAMPNLSQPPPNYHQNRAQNARHLN